MTTTPHPSWRIILLLAVLLGATPALASHHSTCTRTAAAQRSACQAEALAGFLLTSAKCLNLTDADERDDCEDEAEDAYRDSRDECRDVHDARRELCRLIGESAYDPDWDLDDFDADFNSPTNPNPYYPLGIGNVKEFEGGGETIRIEILNETKHVDGVTCIVANDVVHVDGELKEDTRDWFALDLDGNVHYCGEQVQDFETFPGDAPPVPELVAIDGSFKAGTDFDKSGYLFLASPTVGATYRQEWSASNAEDAATIISTSYSYGQDAELDQFMPQALADLLCTGDCIVTRDFSPMAPGAIEYKYHALGIGTFFESKPEDGEFVQLVGCNFDARCALLPAP